MWARARSLKAEKAPSDSILTAYATDNGRQLWAARISDASPSGMAVSLDGTTLFVSWVHWMQRPTTTDGVSTRGRYRAAVAAFQTSTGQVRWRYNYHPGSTRLDILGTQLGALTMAPNDRTLYATGWISDRKSAAYLTVALQRNGQLQWARSYGARQGAMATGMAVDDSGSRLFVVGAVGWDRAALGTGPDLTGTTVAYNARTGRRLWTATLSGPDGYTAVTDISLDAHGRVFVTGTSGGQFRGSPLGLVPWGTYNELIGPSPRAVTASYVAATGRLLWSARYPEPSAGYAITTHPGTHSVVITGFAAVDPIGNWQPSYHFLTLAYRDRDGRQLWEGASDAMHPGQSWGAQSDPRQKLVIATGFDATSADVAVPVGGMCCLAATGADWGVAQTVAYDATTGAELWHSIYNESTTGADVTIATTPILSPDGKHVFVPAAYHDTVGHSDGFLLLDYPATAQNSRSPDS